MTMIPVFSAACRGGASATVTQLHACGRTWDILGLHGLGRTWDVLGIHGLGTLHTGIHGVRCNL